MFDAPFRRGGSDTVAEGRRLLLRSTVSAILLPALCLPVRPARAGLNLLTNEFTLTRDELQAELTRRFPQTRRYGELVSLSLHEPQLSLDGQANRATLESRLAILSPLLRPSPVGGRLAMSSALKWDASSLAVRLQDPRLERLRIDGVAGSDAQQLERISASVAQEALQGLALHTFRPEDLRLGVKVRGITVGADEIKVQFE